MLNAGTENEHRPRPQHGEKTTYKSPEETEEKAEYAASIHSGMHPDLYLIRDFNLHEDKEFWREAVELNPRLLFFVPEAYMTAELCALAVVRDGQALRYVPASLRSMELIGEGRVQQLLRP